MKKIINDGGPAFPVSTSALNDGPAYGHQDGPDTWQFSGMSLRDYLAGQALHGLVKENQTKYGKEVIVKACYEYADAMLAERAKEQS